SRPTTAPSPRRRRRGRGPRARSTDAFRAREEAGRAEEQHEDDRDEADRVAIARRDVPGAQLLGDAEQKPAERRAREVAEPAEDDDREGLQRREVAHRRIGEEDRAKQRPRRGGAGGAERERERVEARAL